MPPAPVGTTPRRTLTPGSSPPPVPLSWGSGATRGMLSSTTRLNGRLEATVTDSALFIGWGATAAGRERQSVELFQESLRYLANLVTEGRVASVEPFFLEPHGGDLEGFFVVRGDLDELNKVRYEDDFQRMSVRAQAVVSNFGIVQAKTGEQLNKHMGWFTEAAREVSSD